MRKLFVLLLAGVQSVGWWCEAAKGTTPSEELYSLYAGKDFFALAERLAELEVDDPRHAFFAGQVDAAFRRDARAEQELGEFLGTEGASGEWRREAWLALGNSRLRRGNYARAAQALAEALRASQANFSDARRRDAEQNLAVARALRDVPAQTSEIRVDATELPVGRDKFGLLHIDAQVNGQPTRGLFDTLANGNVASENFARQHGLRMLKEPAAMEAITGQEFAARFGVADLVRIGGVEFRHVVFTILKPGKLELPGSGEASSLIIGLPLILGLERVRFDAAHQRLRIGGAREGATVGGTVQNVAFDGLTPLVRATYQGTKLPFALDTGMQRTQLTRKFGQRFPRALVGAAPREVRQTGVGSHATLWVSVVPGLELGVGGGARSLRDVPVWTADRSFLPPVFGAVGADFLRGEFDLDFRAMRLAVPSGAE